MRIGIDIRCLLEENPSGVSFYTQNLLDNLFLLDKENQYILFYNAYSKVNTQLIDKYQNFSNVIFAVCHYPNKIFNFFINFFQWPKIDKLIGGVDIFFAPNWQFISLSPNCKKIITVHDLSFDLYPEFLTLKRKLWHLFINPKKFINRADKIIAVSNSTKQDLINYYQISDDKIQVVHSGINYIKEEKQNDSQELPKKFILTISTLEPRKNIESLIIAFKQLRQQTAFADYYLLIAGAHGWKAKKIYQAAQADNHILFLGFVNNQEKIRLYKNAAVFVYPTFYEGFGFPPLEALYYHVPVIAAANSSLPEILKNNAVYINPYDINEIECALRLILSKNMLKEYVAIDHDMLINSYTWQQTADRTLKIFSNLI